MLLSVLEFDTFGNEKQFITQYRQPRSIFVAMEVNRSSFTGIELTTVVSSLSLYINSKWLFTDFDHKSWSLYLPRPTFTK